MTTTTTTTSTTDFFSLNAKSRSPKNDSNLIFSLCLSFSPYAASVCKFIFGCAKLQVGFI